MNKRRLKLLSACATATVATAPASFAQDTLPGYCNVESARDTLLVRPEPGEVVIDDINWFARPVPSVPCRPVPDRWATSTHG